MTAATEQDWRDLFAFLEQVAALEDFASADHTKVGPWEALADPGGPTKSGGAVAPPGVSVLLAEAWPDGDEDQEQVYARYASLGPPFEWCVFAGTERLGSPDVDEEDLRRLRPTYPYGHTPPPSFVEWAWREGSSRVVAWRRGRRWIHARLRVSHVESPIFVFAGVVELDVPATA